MEEDAGDYLYNLVGILVHAGVAQGGHYYSYIRDRGKSAYEDGASDGRGAGCAEGGEGGAGGGGGAGSNGGSEGDGGKVSREGAKCNWCAAVGGCMHRVAVLSYCALLLDCGYG